jgi:hypothetical protein
VDACLPKDEGGNFIAEQERSNVVHDLLAFLPVNYSLSKLVEDIDLGEIGLPNIQQGCHPLHGQIHLRKYVLITVQTYT